MSVLYFIWQHHSCISYDQCPINCQRGSLRFCLKDHLKYRLVFWREQEKDIAERKMRVEEPRRRWAENRLATGKAGRRQRGREGWAVGVEGRVLHPRSSCFSPPLVSPSPMPGAQARLGNLSVLSEMSAEINLANPPRWPVTLISLKFQAD